MAFSISNSLLAENSDMLAFANAVRNYLAALASGNGCISAPTCAEGGTTSKAKITTAFRYVVNGQVFNKAATDNFWTLTTAASLANSQDISLYLCIDGNGVASVAYGVVAATGASVFPVVPANVAAVGSIVITADSSHTFTGGTTALGNATGITVTFADVFSNNPKGVQLLSNYIIP